MEKPIDEILKAYPGIVEKRPAMAQNPLPLGEGRVRVATTETIASRVQMSTPSPQPSPTGRGSIQGATHVND
jgi:hypothetical protein